MDDDGDGESDVHLVDGDLGVHDAVAAPPYTSLVPSLVDEDGDGEVDVHLGDGEGDGDLGVPDAVAAPPYTSLAVPAARHLPVRLHLRQGIFW